MVWGLLYVYLSIDLGKYCLCGMPISPSDYPQPPPPLANTVRLVQCLNCVVRLCGAIKRMQQTHTRTHTHTDTHTVVLNFHTQTAYDKHSRWIHSSISSLEGGIHFPNPAPEHCGPWQHWLSSTFFTVSVLNQNTSLESSLFLCNRATNFDYAVCWSQL